MSSVDPGSVIPEIEFPCVFWFEAEFRVKREDVLSVFRQEEAYRLVSWIENKDVEILVCYCSLDQYPGKERFPRGGRA